MVPSTKKIKICYVANSVRAVKFLLLPQLKFLIKEGYDVSVVCSGGEWLSDIEKEGIKVKVVKIRRKISPVYDVVTLYKLWSYFKYEKFHIVHTNNPKPGLLGQLAARMAGVSIIVNTIHGLYFHENSSKAKRSIFIFVERVAAICSDLIFSVNKEDIDTLIKNKIAPSEKIKYLGNGINTKKFTLNRFTKEFVAKKKKEINVPENYSVVGIVARLVKEKGYMDLFEAFRIILEKYPKTILLAIGPKEPEKKDAIVPKIVKDFGIENNAIFLMERDDVDELYSLMDVFVLPSYREGLPISLLEAMAEKRAIVATDIRGCREEIENGKSGILVPIKNSEKLAKAIIFLFNNPDKAKEFGENARLTVEKYFNEDIVFGRIKEEYIRIIKEKSK